MEKTRTSGGLIFTLYLLRDLRAHRASLMTGPFLCVFSLIFIMTGHQEIIGRAHMPMKYNIKEWPGRLAERSWFAGQQKE